MFETKISSSDDVKSLESSFDVIPHIWIEMSDGVRLSAKIWLPKEARVNPVPAILEYIPYRKSDAVAVRDHQNHAWFAARGYACIRPDMRGHGDSEGIMVDEYLPREQQDAVEIIDWISSQEWCSGSVGMMGISWGGIASLQAATHQPPALKAIIPVCASVDRYYDDGGYLFGAYQGQGLGWGGVMFGYCVRPPDPALVGDSWRDLWLARLEQTPMFAEKWLRHQLRDDTWVQGSICEVYEKIKTPVLGVGGWNDCWPNTVIRLLENIESPCRVVSGPWGHSYPNLSKIGPAAGFLQLALKWWDYWLKGVQNDVMDAPKFVAFIQDSHPPDPNPSNRPGRWIGEDIWPTSNVKAQVLWLGNNSLRHEPTGLGTTALIKSPNSTGLCSGEYMPWSGTAELPHDQRPDDSKSVCFDGDALQEPLELLGTSTLHLKLSSDKKCGLICARLCDLSPDGSSTLISFGILNLKLRNGRESVAEVRPGDLIDVKLKLNDTGWRIRKGHRLRLALSTHLWPMAWPISETATITVHTAFSRLELPVRMPNKGEEKFTYFEAPTAADAPPHLTLREPSGSRKITHDIRTGEIRYDIETDGGELKFDESGLIFGSDNAQSYMINDTDQFSARAEYRANFSFSRDQWSTSTRSELIVTCDAEHFFLKGCVSAFEDGTEVFVKNWDTKIPRIVY